MDITPIIDPLNEHQRQAVTTESQHTLVLAGAGSGKTRVLTHRIAWLMEVEGYTPYGIMAVTFTNKAAGEMKARIEELCGQAGNALWVGTFHGLAHRLLRMHWQEAGLPKAFQVMDSDDQQRMVKRVIRELELDEATWQPKQMTWFINSRKDEGLRPEHIPVEQGDYVREHQVRIYQAYEDACRRAGSIDFAEILLRCHETLRDNERLLNHYRQRFGAILVDEFQDTNAVQYAWIRLITGIETKTFIVGDDDQSIYGWRGAKIENIHRYGRDFADAVTVRLEQNYRSTNTILRAANAVISNNSGRLGKELWTDGGDGEPISLYSGFNEYDEAQYVVSRIQQWVDGGQRRDEAAILYRSNAQSRTFEELLLREGIPYRVYGGLRFFERKEIKDALAYMRLMTNPHDDTAFERVVNFPPRGIGAQTLEKIRMAAREQRLSLWDTAIGLASNGLSGRASNAIKAFVELIEVMKNDSINDELHIMTEMVIDGSGLMDHYKKEKGDKGESRVENLQELMSAARLFVTDEEEDISDLDAFLAHAALEAGDQQGDAWEDCVQLMSLHSAKGLEFPLVFLVGMEEGLFPHMRSSESHEGLEEERRLAYVGMTRAMEQLVMTYAERRRFQGREMDGVCSRFIGEVPNDLIQEVRPRIQTQMARGSGGGGISNRQVRENEAGIALGARVTHPKFGTGVVMQAEGAGSHARVQVNFESEGNKWLILEYANLTVL